MRERLKRLLVPLLILGLLAGPLAAQVQASADTDTPAAMDAFSIGAEDEGPDAPAEEHDSNADEKTDNGDDILPDTEQDNIEEAEPSGEERTDEQDIPDEDGADATEPEPVQEQEEPLPEEPEPALEALMMEEPEQEDVVRDEDQLADWCEAHEDSDGRVTLGAVLTLTKTISLHGGGDLVINTGPYGLVYDGGSIDPDGVEITGEGVDVPVLDIYDAGGSWNSAVQALRVTATGRDGVGGVALRVRAYDGYDDFDTLSARKEGRIRSYGEGAVGLYLDDIVNVYGMNIAVEGDNSIAVYIELAASLYYCKLSASGAGATSSLCGSTFGFVVLDACSVTPDAENARVIDRKISSIIGRNFYCPVKQNGDIEYSDAFRFYLSGNGYAWADLLLDFGGALDAIDTGFLGRTVVQANLSPPFQGLGLEDDFPLEIVVDVRNPAAPCITNIQFDTAGSNEAYVLLEFWDTYDPADENVILWRSDDGGESWYDFTDSPDIEWHGDYLHFYYDEITDPILLQLEYAGAGESNVVRLYSVDGEVGGGFDGDRTGTDRVVPGSGNESGTTDNDDNSGSGSYAGNTDNDGGETPADTGSSTAANATQPEDEAIIPDANNAVAAVPFAETAFAAVSATENPSVSPEPETGEQTASAGAPAEEEYAAMTPEPDAAGAHDIPERTASESSIDARGWIAMSGLTAILFAGAYIRLRQRRVRRRRT